jgi:MFS family permease
MLSPEQHEKAPEGKGGAETAKPSYSALLRQGPFRSLWIAQLVSQSGDAIFDVALLWLVLVTTGSASLVGLTQAAVLIPATLGGPVAGVYADRMNRRNLMIVSNLFEGGVTAALSLFYIAGLLDFPKLILFVLLLYTGAVFFRAANTAIIPRIVSRENLGAANGLFSLTLSANQLAGFAVGGVILAVVGAGVSISYDSLTFFFAAGILSLIARNYGQTGGAPATRPSFRREFGEGLRYVRGSRLFVELIAFGMIVNFFGSALSAGMAPYVKDWLGGGAEAYGFILSSFALGMIVGAVVVGKMNFRSWVGKLLFVGVMASGAFIALAGLVDTVSEGLVVLFGAGIFIGAINLPIETLVQSKVPGELLGRASTVLGSLLLVSQPAGALAFGGLVGYFPIGSVFLGSGAVLVALSAALYLPFSALRNARY